MEIRACSKISYVFHPLPPPAKPLENAKYKIQKSLGDNHQPGYLLQVSQSNANKKKTTLI